MCGIFGYYFVNVSKRRGAVLETLLRGLRRLEYRGYDSAGICLETSEGPVVIKSVGKIDELDRMVYARIPADELQQTIVDSGDGHSAIAHTRWATHGPPCEVNSHPHVSGPSNGFVVVHNGIITNYKALKSSLEKHGVDFVTETDTEVIPKLLQYIYDDHVATGGPPTFHELVAEVCRQLEGAFAILVKSVFYPGELVATKRGSPLILGVKSALKTPGGGPVSNLDVSMYKSDGPLECFLASDASAVVEHTKQVLVLEDHDLLHLDNGVIGAFNIQKRTGFVHPVSRMTTVLEMEVQEIMKGGFEHYMKKEIHEQPESLTQTMRGRIRGAGAPGASPVRGLAVNSLVPAVNGLGIADSPSESNGHAEHATLVNRLGDNLVMLGGLLDWVDTIRRARRILLIGCGTSYHAAVAGRQVMEELVGIPVALELASDLQDRKCPLFRDDVCVFVSQSGETADTLGALRFAKQRGALCVGMTNTVGSAIARETTCGVHINAGAEIGVASTKAYTSQIVCLVLMAVMLAGDSRSLQPHLADVVASLKHLPDLVRTTLALDKEMEALAGELQHNKSILVFGRGPNYATALEAALKIKEISYIHSEGILAGEIKHGPLALVDESLPLIVVCTRDGCYGKMIQVLQQLSARGANLIVLCNEGDDEVAVSAGSRARFVRVPETVQCLQPIVNIVPLQLLAYHLAVKRGFNVDQPRNLAKSVTVTEN